MNNVIAIQPLQTGNTVLPKKSKAVIVMTATITPSSGMVNLQRRDPEVRLQDYCDALEFYLKMPDEYVDRVLFLENSGSDLSKLETLAKTIEHNKQVEFISFVGEYDPKHGKGTGETQMLDYGLSHSRFLCETDIFWKVTGRLKVLNMAQLLKTAPAGYELYCDLRDVPLIGDALGGNRWMDLRVFSCTVRNYNQLMRGRALDFSSLHCSPEKTIFEDVKNLMNTGEKVVPRFLVQPKIAGFSGFGNASYRSKSYIAKESLRQVTRLVAPWLWL